MRRRISRLAVALAIVVSGTVDGQEPARTPPSMPPRDVTAPRAGADEAQGVIRGVVTAAETGTPLRRVNVTLQRASAGGGMPLEYDPRHERSVTTDDQGRFEFSGVAAGRWRVTAGKAGYLTRQAGQRRPFETPAPLVLGGGQQLQVNIELARAGAINGRVHDEFGEPVTGARIQLLRARMVRKQRYLQPVGDGDLSDDTGAFRLHGLAPGEYYVSASLRVAPLDSIVQTTYAPTYYPGTGSFAEAQRVFVSAGAEVNADFPVTPVRTARLTGFVQSSTGAPASAFLNLVTEAAEMGAPIGIGTATREDGSFLMADVPPGAYTLYASLREGGLDAEGVVMPLTVYGDDLSGLTLVTAKPASIRATLVRDAGVTRALPDSVGLVARSARAGGESKFGAADRANPEPLIAPPGPFFLDADIPEGWALKAITVADADMTDAPIDLKGEQNVPVRLVLTDKFTQVSGTVSGIAPGQNVGVVIFAEDAGRWAPPSRFVRSAVVDERGAFRIAALPPGTRYLAVAVEGLEEGEADDPDFLARMRDHAISFALADGEQRVLGLAVESRR